jgi:hypothetical protein
VNRTLLNRLAALEAARPTEYRPVDMTAVMGRMNMTLVAYHEGHKQPGESVLTAYSRACGYRDEAELFRVALNDRAEFVRRYAVVCPPCYAAYQCASPTLAKSIREGQDEARAKEAGDVCAVVIQAFLAEEMAHQLIDAVFPFWRRPNAKPVDVDDEVLSDIGRSLLVLAERRARKAA